MTAPLDIVIAAEDESDARRIKLLVDRILVEEIEWLREQPELLEAQRQWRGQDPSSAFLDIHKIDALADARHLPRRRGHFEGTRGANCGRAEFIEDVRTLVAPRVR